MATKKADFQWITNRSTTPYVTLDNQMRLYVSKPARELIGLPDGKFRLIAGYDFANHRIVLAKPEIVRATNIEPFSFDKRAYSKAKQFVEKARLEGSLPLRFTYAGKDYADYPSGAFAFVREGHKSHDG